MYKKLLYFLLYLIGFALLFITTSISIFANEYVLPYPSFMPGNPLYRFSEFFDTTKSIWSFGSVTKFKYHLALADKKLVEGKTLFEYKQYLLASEAILVYNYQLASANHFLYEAKNEGKNISEKKRLFQDAIDIHHIILVKLKEDNPKDFFWQPEKGSSQIIKIESILNKAIDLGKTCGQF